MSEGKKKEAELDSASLAGYKQQAAPLMKARLDWEKDLIFHGHTQRGYEIDFDAKIEWGCAPTESLLLSLAGCMAIDTVSFIKKMRGEISDFRIDITGERNPLPPQYYTRIGMVLNITGKNISEKQVKKAVALSHEKYCSVYHSLRKDMEVSVDYVLNTEE
ncbi:MAG: OsmC family protein [Nitrospiraceae bacterium]|nr:OsmC family protein [Nitrospiraceae bacterium]